MPVGHDEREIKLVVPADFEMPDPHGGSLNGNAAIEAEPLELSATYYDTEDMRLLGNKITMRFRSGEDGGAKWTLKLPVSGDDTVRREIEQKGPPDEVPAEIMALLFGVLGGAELRPTAYLKTRRRRWRMQDTNGVDEAEVVDDRVQVLEGNNIRGSFREIEVEARSADARRLDEIAKSIAKAGGKFEQRSKFSRALEALNGAATMTPTPLDPQDPAEYAVGPALAGGLKRLLMHDPAARMGQIEGVHQMRVGSRRLRSIMRTFSDLIDDAAESPIVDELRSLGRALGTVRDIDVLTEELRGQAAGGGEEAMAPVFAALDERRVAGMGALNEVLNSTEYIAMLDAIRALIAGPRNVETSAGACKDVMPKLVARAAGRLKSAACGLNDESPEADFHRTRVLAKRARYTAETVAVFVKPKEADATRAFAAEAERVQNVLGQHQDAVMTRDTVLEMAPEHPADGKLNLWLGRIAEREEQRAKEKRAEFFDLWHRLDDKKSKRWPRA